MNFVSVPLGDGISLTIAQRVEGGPWYASTKRLSSLLGYPQCRSRSFIHPKLKPWIRGTETWVSINCLSFMLKSHAPVSRKNIIETILSRVKGEAKYGSVLEEDPDQTTDDSQITQEGDPQGSLDFEDGPKDDPEDDPEIVAWQSEIEIIEGLIDARREELSSTAHVVDIQAKRDALIREASALDAELKRISTLVT